MSIKILLVDDHKIIREGLGSLINKNRDMEVIAETDNGRSAIRLAKEIRPDVVVMDISLPDLNGIDATRQIIAEIPDIKVIALSMYSDKRYVAGMFQAGVSGYLAKDCAFDELVKAISAVVGNQTYISQKIAHVVVKDYVKHLSTNDTSLLSVLTDREREILQLIAEGKNTNQIASILFLSTKTVATHRQQIMKKLNLHSVADLTKFAIREGLTSIDNI